jgi:two-component system cell cycle sensor histidine kinase PleC
LSELHDGTFEIRSKLRQGTAVTVTFPRRRVMEAPGDKAEMPSRARAALRQVSRT